MPTLEKSREAEHLELLDPAHDAMPPDHGRRYEVGTVSIAVYIEMYMPHPSNVSFVDNLFTSGQPLVRILAVPPPLDPPLQKYCIRAMITDGQQVSDANFANLQFNLTPGTSVGPPGTELFTLILDYGQPGTMGRVAVADLQNGNWTANVLMPKVLVQPRAQNLAMTTMDDFIPNCRYIRTGDTHPEAGSLQMMLWPINRAVTLSEFDPSTNEAKYAGSLEYDIMYCVHAGDPARNFPPQWLHQPNIAKFTRDSGADLYKKVIASGTSNIQSSQ